MAPSDNKKPRKSARGNHKRQPQDPKSKARTEPTNRPRGLTIVGIGASAGGLAALTAFFGSIPSDTGLGFVVVTHLHPEHESHLAELLQKHTQMPAMQVNAKVRVQPDHIYIIPPSRGITLVDSHLETVEFSQPRGQRTPIDFFFRSLAEGHSESIAVILSGGGTDGSVGIKDVKEKGGLIMVQQPDDAEYDSMPRAAISTGLADIIMPAAQLAEKISEYSRHRPRLPHDPGQLTEAEVETLQRILAQVHARTGHDFNQYKRATILRRVERRMQLNGFLTLEDYLAHLRTNAGEAQAMFNDILIGVTNFFRDHGSWEALAEKVIPALFEHKNQAEEVRIWSIGCATGEEAYSLAILALEYASKLDFRPQIQIFGSDLDENSIAQARNGLYPAAIEADVSPERLARFFTQEGEYYRVNREVREMVLFTSHNVLRDPPFSRQDLIACRNVLIYLQRMVQDRVFDIFHYALSPDGYLFLGTSESAEQLEELFSVIDKNHRIYQARPGLMGKQHVPYMPLMVRRGTRTTEHGAGAYLQVPRFLDEPGVAKQHEKALETYAPPSVLVNLRYEILHVSESAGRYLLQPRGPITGELLKLVRSELQLDLRAALFQAFEKGQATFTRPIAVQFNGQPHRVVIAVRPRTEKPERDREERQALVSFLEDESGGMIDTSAMHLPIEQAKQDEVLQQLQAEVLRLKEQLQITVEEYDSSNEEMKAANEELQSINEEYRSTTEELETSKEELQSVNEELQTVNNEMRSKLDDVSRARQELEDLLGATEIPTLYLDRQLCIQRYSAGIQKLFNVMPADRGRPISHLTNKLTDYHEFMPDAQHVIRTLGMIERETHIRWDQSQPDATYLIRMRPYRTAEDRIDGVVITFIDVTSLKKAELDLLHAKETLESRVEERTSALEDLNQKLLQTRDLFKSLFHTSPVPTSLTTLQDGVFLDVNEAYLHYYGLEAKDVIGRTSRELHVPLAPDLRPALIRRLQTEHSIRNIQMETTLRSGEVKTILVSLQTVTVEEQNALILAFIDITERVHAERDFRIAATNLSAAEQAERLRISQVLHDDLQQNIFAVKVQLSFLARALEKNDLDSARTDLQQLDEWLAASIAITRQLSIDLSPPVLQGEGLTEALLWLAAQMKKQYGLKVTINTNDVRAIMQADVRSLVFQSIRELLFNVVKHAEANEARVTFQSIPGHVSITISDDGKGFDANTLERKGSTGLRRLRDRLIMVGAALKIDSGPDEGTRITIEAPLSDSSE